ncbi:solid-state culture expressed protein (Aos23) [Aspergillus bombycis]|uniref:Solid-state culture expressed protein (Aos23) n=1 Tax=Aspergillus bombycis TaxID=109264 RepID=A0A1F7ZM90_9EURO|nr:solid-state culture expressed protein (Aos23) [Aspergillus bombycis]OGM40564.1 solid-state culture expressed protein (Aos23) [Aspergillus bombycis]
MEPFDKAWHTAADSLRNDYRSSEQQWTQHGEEPISGVQGRGTATDPYDAGNRPEQPGAPQSKENTALVPEALSSITPADRSSSLKSSNSKAASGPAAMQPELNPIGETAAKYGSQPHRVPEQRSLGSNLDRHNQPSGLTHGHSDTNSGLNQGSLAGAGAATIGTAGAGSGHKSSGGGLGDATAAQASALPSESHPSGLRHTGTLGGATSAQTSALGADTTHPTGLRHPSTQKSGLDRGVETSGLGHTTSSTGQTSPMKPALDQDAQATGLRQPASTTHKPVFEKDTHASSGLEGSQNLGPTTSYGGSETQIPDRSSQTIGTHTSTSGLEGSRNLDSTTSYGSQAQIPDRSSQSIGTGIEARQPSSGITEEPTSTAARHPSSGIAESAPQKSNSTTEQRTPSTTAEGQSSTQESTSKPTKKDDDVEHVGFPPKTDHVSKEALRGPSVAEPREHWKRDEKVARAEDDGKPAAAAGEPGGSSKHESSDKKHSKDSSHSGGTMAHIKEKVERVIHPNKS